MAYMKRKTKNGKIQIDGETIIITSFSTALVDAVWIQGWRRLHERLFFEKNKDGSIPLYKKDNALKQFVRIGEGRIETPAERIELAQSVAKHNRLKELTRVDFSDRPPMRFKMGFTRQQWEAIEWAIDCGISAATTQFREDKETVALVPVLQSVLNEINNRA